MRYPIKIKKVNIVGLSVGFCGVLLNLDSVNMNINWLAGDEWQAVM